MTEQMVPGSWQGTLWSFVSRSAKLLQFRLRKGIFVKWFESPCQGCYQTQM